MHLGPLRGVLGRLATIPETEWAYFEQQLTWRVIDKGEHAVRPDDMCRQISFNAKGLFRMYYTTPDGSEYIKSFIPENHFVTSYSSLLLDTPSFLAIEALERSEVVSFSYQTLQELYRRHICWETVGRKMVENLYIKKEARERQMLLCSAEERYRIFLAEFPGLDNRVPQYHIASYLGISPVSLSRIRAAGRAKSPEKLPR